MTKIEMYASIFFAMSLQLTTDTILDLHFDFYRALEKGADLFPELFFYCVYPAYTIIFLNRFPYKKPLTRKALYIAVNTLLASAVESLFVLVGFYYYVTWTIWLSAVCYLIVLTLFAVNLSLIRKLIKKDYKEIKAE